MVILVEEGCSGLTNVVTESIELVHSDGRRTVVLTYEDAGWDPDVHGHTTPTVNWITPDRLKISIGAVAAIHKRIAKADGVVIEYNIGRVLFK